MLKEWMLGLRVKIYKTIIRLAMLYEVESLMSKMLQEKKMNVVEMKMLQCSRLVTRMNNLRNNIIRGVIGVTELSKKVQEWKLQWYGQDDDYMGGG